MMKPNLSYNEYKELVEAAPIMIWRANLKKECDYFNEIWLNFTGRSMEQEIGNGWAEGVHPEDYERCLDIYISNFDKRQAFEMEYRLKRHDGEYRWIFDRGVPFYNDEGIFRGFIGSCVDVHARKISEIEKEQKMEELSKLIPICAWCHKIRKDDGYWEQVESYLKKVSGRKLTHGMCPDCLEKVKKEHPF